MFVCKDMSLFFLTEALEWEAFVSSKELFSGATFTKTIWLAFWNPVFKLRRSGGTEGSVHSVFIIEKPVLEIEK